MSVQKEEIISQASQQSLLFLKKLFRDYHPLDFTVRLWDGTQLKNETDSPPRFTIVLQHPGAIRKMFWPPNDLTLGEAYIYNDFDIEGDVEAAYSLSSYLRKLILNKARLLSCTKDLFKLPSENNERIGYHSANVDGKLHSIERDKSAVTYHYDVSNDFYKLYLDKNMVYSCAYFTSTKDDLDKAQERKLDYICRKLRLRPGEHLLDIGCGWGGLIIHASKNYGVKSLGITLSQQQADLANKRINKVGLSDICRAEVFDYREVDESRTFDKLVSVGMFEHVGKVQLPDYFKKAWRLLRPGGVFLNHGIGRRVSHSRRKSSSFIQRYVFPDGELLPISDTLTVAENVGFEVRDVESLREHYALTLRHWVKRLENNYPKAIQAADEVTYRIWRLYMAGSAYNFKVGQINVYQALLAK